MYKYLLILLFNSFIVIAEEITISKPTDLIGKEISVLSTSNNFDCKYTLNNNYKVNSTCWVGDLDLLFWEETWAYWNGTLNDKYIFEGFIVENGIIKFAYNLTGGENDWQYIDEFDNLLVANLLNDNDASENENSLSRSDSFELKIKKVGLGSNQQLPCSPLEETYIDFMNIPVRVQNECTIGDKKDSTQIIFDITGKEVVKVTRKQFIASGEFEPGDIVDQAIKYYGSPNFESSDNWLAIYGNAHSYTQNGNNISPSQNEYGIGLLIKGYMCGGYSFDGPSVDECNYAGGNYLIEYTLIDVLKDEKQKEDGKKRVIEIQNEKKESLDF